jgi:hypothetical protein
MIKDFFIKKENIFIISIALISIFFVVLGFLFLFFKSNNTDQPRTIPNSIADITWADFSSDILKKKITYPEYMYISEQKEESGVGITIAEFKPRDFLTYFSNQNHVSVYPDGIDNQLFYGKTKNSEYTSATGQIYTRTDYLTVDNKIWAIMFIPKQTPQFWQPRGFVWIQTALKNKESLCIHTNGILINNVTCDPYAGELPVYRGDISGRFIDFAFEIINKNSF